MASFYKNRNKYGAKRTNGFPSKLESAVYDILCLRERAKEICDIKRQQAVVLQDGAKDVRISWKIDFAFTNKKTGKLIYCEAKGIRTNDFILKLKLFRKNPPADLEIWQGDYRRPKLIEIIRGNYDKKTTVFT